MTILTAAQVEAIQKRRQLVEPLAVVLRRLAEMRVTHEAVTFVYGNVVIDTAQEKALDALASLADIPALVASLTAARAALKTVADDVCGYCCPSVWNTGEPQPHSPKCTALRAALGEENAPNG